jgi:predicted acylesterase/phospholipase RssA
MVKYLAIGPGSMGFYVYLGALARLKDKGRLDALSELSGASAGSLLSFMYCLYKGDTKRILEKAVSINVKELMKPNIKSLLKNFGIVPLKPLKNVISEICLAETGKSDITFRELYEHFPIKLYVTSYCVQLQKTMYFNTDTNQDMSVIDTVCASIAVPFLFSSFKMKDGMNYIDGGCMETTPSDPFVGREECLALQIDWHVIALDLKNIKNYAIALLFANMSLRYNYPLPTHKLSVDEDVFDFGASSEAKIRMYMAGYAQEFSG